MAAMIDVMNDEIAFQMLEIVDEMAFIMEVMNDEIAFQILVNVF